MSNGVKETACTNCVHRGVCKHKKDFLDAIKAVNDTNVSWSDGDKGYMKRVIDFECVSNIEVTCKFRQPEIAYPREGFF